MYRLCFSTAMTSAEWAAWVQALGSIVAIAGAAWIAGWQARKQHESAIKLQAREAKSAALGYAETLAVLARTSTKVIEVLSEMVGDRQRVHEIAEGDVHFDIEELVRLDSRILSIPVHSLPPSLVQPTIFLGSTVRQCRQKLELVLRVHRSMDAEAFQDFFESLAEMKTSARETWNDIQKVVDRLIAERDSGAE